jgi:hypothetical protein
MPTDHGAYRLILLCGFLREPSSSAVPYSRGNSFGTGLGAELQILVESFVRASCVEILRAESSARQLAEWIAFLPQIRSSTTNPRSLAILPPFVATVSMISLVKIVVFGFAYHILRET